MVYTTQNHWVYGMCPSLGIQDNYKSNEECRVAFVRTDVSKECSASIIRVIRIGELGTSFQCASVSTYC
jgi:hypothetical protein